MTIFRIFPVVLLLLFTCFADIELLAQSININSTESPTSARLNRSRGLSMLKQIRTELKNRYYDRTFRGIDIDARFKLAEDKIKESSTNSQIFQIIAAVVLELNDSHTFFLPPGRANHVNYGFSMHFVGGTCYIVSVKKDSDAYKKGLRPGDVLVGIENFNVRRENLWLMHYLFYQLNPREQLKLFLLEEDGRERELIIDASFKTLKEREKEAADKRKKKREDPYKCHRLSAQTVTCKLESFSIERKFIDQMMSEASQFANLILDLRGNGGGYVKIEEYLVGHFFDRDIKVADFVMRNRTRERIAKPQRRNAFKGELVILTDSRSGSASEVFARVMQIEKRGTVIGDVSAGAVMTSIRGTMTNARGVPGYETLSYYGLSVTIADLIMSDGKRLEHIGVTPDHPIGPNRNAIVNGSDPILAYAAEFFGVKISAEDAAKIGFLKYHEEEDDEEESDASEA